MKNNSVKTMLLGLLLMVFGAGVFATSHTLAWGKQIDTVLAVGSIVFLVGFVTGVAGFFQKDS